MDILNNANIKGTIFDMDGVILDSMSIWNDLGARYLISQDVTPEDGLREILFSMSLEQGVTYMKKHYQLSKDEPDILQDITNMIQDYYYYEVKAKDGALKLLDTLKQQGIRIVVATSSPRDHIEHALVRNNLLQYIEKIYTTTEFGKSKHSPDIFHLAADYMKLQPAEIMVFEDSLYAAKTAADAGFLTVGVYDADGESNQAKLKSSVDRYVLSLLELTE